MGQTISVVIPNYNGLQLLKENLPKVISSTKKYDSDSEIIVVDDASTDTSISYIRKVFKEVRVIKRKENRGFSSAVNSGIRNANSDLIVLLNTDVVPKGDYLDNAVDLFKDPMVFAVSFHEEGFAWARGYFKNGFVEHENGGVKSIVNDTFWVSGGSGIFRKKVMQKLGGFDEELFNPFYWEDLDLCYRALKRGYKLLWDSKSQVFHDHELTIGALPKRKRELILQRNQLLFIWKNITSKTLIKRHIKGLISRILSHPGYMKVVVSALFRLKTCLKRRRVEVKEAKVSDEAIFAKFI
jgi:GT2 family glycosyltransferase